MPRSSPRAGVSFDRPEAIFLGHSHFDHLGHAGPIAAATGAVVVGTVEHCDEARASAPADSHVNCATPLERTTPFGQVARADGLLAGVGIALVRHRHSPGLSPESLTDFSLLGRQEGDRGCVGHLDPATYLEHLPSDSDAAGFELQNGIADLLQGGGDGGVVLYHFTVGDFTLVYEDTSAAYDEAPEELKASLRSLPATDVLVGSVASLNSGIRCMRDPRQYAEALRARMFVPNHHDPYVIQPSSDTAGAAGEELEREFARVPEERRPCLRQLADPEDYVRPELLTFEVDDLDPCLDGARRVAPRQIRLAVRARARRSGLRVVAGAAGVSSARVELHRRGRVVRARWLTRCPGGTCRTVFAPLPPGRYVVIVTAETSSGRVTARRNVRVRTRRWRP